MQNQWRESSVSFAPHGRHGGATRERLWPALLIMLLACCAATAAEDYAGGRAAYLNGDYPLALQILRPLAEDGNSEAQKLLGVMYDYGHGVAADPAVALNWYIRAAEQGDPAVQYQVGAKYFRGDGSRQDQVEAAKWWELAANGGQVDAQFNLGLMYFRGLAVDRDDGRAVDLFRRAAEQGHAHAQYSLGVMYAFARGIDKDYGAALDWFNRSAAQGVAQAQYNLGVFYENGFGVERDRRIARQWYERAAAQGLPDARDKLAALGIRGEADAPGLIHPDDLSGVDATGAAAGFDTATRVYVPGDEGPAPAAAAAIDVTTAQPAPPDPEPAPVPETISPTRAPPAAAAMPPEPDGMRREQWVLSQSGEAYTLQIGSVTSEKDMVRFLKDNNLDAEAAYIRVEVNGTTRYNALYGVYPSYAAANAAVASLPESLQQVKPWVRNFGVLQRMLQ